jgi:hypothetical protein
MQRAFLTLLGTFTCLAGSSAVAHAQTGAAEFDPSRAILRDSSIFEPFYVKETVPLRQALEDGTLERHTPLALMDHPHGRRRKGAPPGALVGEHLGGVDAGPGEKMPPRTLLACHPAS